MSVPQTTVVEDQITIFKKLSSQWWSENGELHSLHIIAKKVMSQIIVDYVKDGKTKNELMTHDLPLAGLNILEVGCGGGILSEQLAKMGCNLTAIDITPDLIEVAKDHASSDPVTSKIRYITISIEDHAKENFEKYDVIVSNFVLEHVNDHDFFIKSCVQCLKQNGSIFLSAIGKTIWSKLIVIYYMEYIARIVPRGLHPYEQLITAEDTQSILNKYNCETKNTRGLYHDRITGRTYWIPTLKLLYLTHAIKNGSVST